MTIGEAITRLDALKFNTYTPENKIEWLSRLDSAVKLEIIDNHSGAENISFNGYDENTPQNTVLLVPAPFDEVYLRWMEAQIDYHNGELDKFNTSIIMYNTAFDAYQKYYTRTHKPVQSGRRFLF